ncbi:MAG: hypothetical protein IPJ08_14215 [Burkholderiales bacterium]|nr:hypothetical protein [Burkholderiales bacterium]
MAPAAIAAFGGAGLDVPQDAFAVLRAGVLHLLVIERSKVLGQPDPHLWWRWLRQRIDPAAAVHGGGPGQPFWTALARSDLAAQFRSGDEACFYRAREG